MQQLNRILKVLNKELRDYDDELPVKLLRILEQNPLANQTEFIAKAKQVKLLPLGRSRRLTKSELLQEVYSAVKEPGLSRPRQEAAKFFIQKFMQPGEPPAREKLRQEMIDGFHLARPHGRLLGALNRLLQKISASYQLGLHGTKEYSGVDLVKHVGEARIGFQVKSPNDQIDEAHIRSQHSKAREWQLDGYVLILAMRRTPKVDDAIQVAFHLFESENRRGLMFCRLVTPGQFAELLQKYRIRVL